MGVPTFFRWLCTRYPKIIKDAVESELIDQDGRQVPADLDRKDEATGEDVDPPNGVFDCLYLDMNALIHPCTHPEEGKPPKNESEMFELIFLYIDRLLRIIRPRKLLYMAVDGCAPRAKMNQQRARRFRAAQEREEQAEEMAKLKQEWEAEGRKLPPKQALSEPFDSNVITPGTKFMQNLNTALTYYVHDRTNNDPLWIKNKFRCIVSDCQLPGEGEHKLLDFIRIQRAQPEYDPNTRHCIYGADADLIHLALASHETHFCIIREVVLPKEEKKKDPWETFQGDDEEDEEEKVKEKPFQILNVGILRQYLWFEFEPLREKLPFPYSFERCVDDFVFFCFFVGNDFLPHLPSLSIRDGSIDMMILLYKEILPRLGDYLTDAGVLNLETTERYLEDLGSVEDQVFKNRLAREAKRNEEFDQLRKGDKEKIAEIEPEDDDEDVKLEIEKRKLKKQEEGDDDDSPKSKKSKDDDDGNASPKSKKSDKDDDDEKEDKDNDKSKSPDKKKPATMKMSQAMKKMAKAKAKGKVKKPTAMMKKAGDKKGAVGTDKDKPLGKVNTTVSAAQGLAAMFDNDASSSDEEGDSDDDDDDDEEEEEDNDNEEEEKPSSTPASPKAKAKAKAKTLEEKKKKIEEEEKARALKKKKEEEDREIELAKKKKASSAAAPTGEKQAAKFYEKLRARLQDKKDLGKEQADTIRLGEGAHWKRRYYSEKFAVSQEDLVDFLQRIRKSYVEGLCWVLKYYYQGVSSWTWFYPFHYAPFGSDLIGMSSLKIDFALGKNFEPVQQLMAVLPPVSARAAGIPKMMMPLMESVDSPIADFFPSDFGLDLNGKRFAWQGVVLLPFIDEPRLLRILKPMIPLMTASEKMRNEPHHNLLYGHVSDLKKKLPPKGSTNKRLLKDNFLFGFVTGQRGAGEEIVSPIEGLFDVDESKCVETKYEMPERVTHSIELLDNATFEAQIVDQSDLDDISRLKGFGGMQAKKIISQALGINIKGGGKKGKGKGKDGKFGGGGGGFDKGNIKGKDGKGKGKKGFGKMGGSGPGPMGVPMTTMGPSRGGGRAGPY